MPSCLQNILTILLLDGYLFKRLTFRSNETFQTGLTVKELCLFLSQPAIN
jgi:hypothetical protein